MEILFSAKSGCHFSLSLLLLVIHYLYSSLHLHIHGKLPLSFSQLCSFVILHIHGNLPLSLNMHIHEILPLPLISFSSTPSSTCTTMEISFCTSMETSLSVCLSWFQSPSCFLVSISLHIFRQSCREWLYRTSPTCLRSFVYMLIWSTHIQP